MPESVKKILLTVLILMAGTGLLFAGNRVAFQETYPVSAVKGVKINLMSEEVQVALWNRNEFRVTVVSDYGDYPVPRVSGNVLICEDTMGGNRHKCLIEIKVPESFHADAAYGGWAIKTASGAINASKLWGDTITIESMSGEIMLSKCESQIGEIKSSSGAIHLSQCIFSGIADVQSISGSIMFAGIADGLYCETTSGSINVAFDRPPVQDCSFYSVTGTVSVTLPENTGFKLAFNTKTGSVYNAFTGYSGGKSGIDTYGNGYIVVHAETSTGSIRILRK